MSSTFSIEEDLTLAKELCSLAGEIAVEYFRRGIESELKEDGTLVTNADREVEASMVDLITRSRPTDSVLGEEFGAFKRSARRWILDPIDGTSNFIAGDSAWGANIALESDEHLILGVITRPLLGQSWWATRGGGAYRTQQGTLESTPLRVSSTSELSKSRVTVWSAAKDERAAALKSKAVWVEPNLNAILDLCEGQMEIVVDPAGKEWDHAAAVVLVREAGGRFSDAGGSARYDRGEGWYTNGHVHRELEGLFAT